MRARRPLLPPPAGQPFPAAPAPPRPRQSRARPGRIRKQERRKRENLLPAPACGHALPPAQPPRGPCRTRPCPQSPWRALRPQYLLRPPPPLIPPSASGRRFRRGPRSPAFPAASAMPAPAPRPAAGNAAPRPGPPGLRPATWPGLKATRQARATSGPGQKEGHVRKKMAQPREKPRTLPSPERDGTTAPWAGHRRPGRSGEQP